MPMLVLTIGNFKTHKNKPQHFYIGNSFPIFSIIQQFEARINNYLATAPTYLKDVDCGGKQI